MSSWPRSIEPERAGLASATDEPDRSAAAYGRGLALLARREHSRRELRDKLLVRGLDEAAVDAAVDRLAERGFQSDSRFAQWLARSRIAQGHGPVRILAELRQYGVDPAEARLALDEQTPDWHALALDLCRRRFRAPAQDHGERVKRANFLARRGFPADIARQVAGDVHDEG